MFPMAVTFPLGLILGFMLVFKHRSMKAKGVPAKIGIGLVAGFGICILLNAFIEILDLIGLLPL